MCVARYQGLIDFLCSRICEFSPLCRRCLFLEAFVKLPFVLPTASNVCPRSQIERTLRARSAHAIDGRLTEPCHPWANGQVERVVRTIRETAVRAFHDTSMVEMRCHLRDWLAPYNFAKQPKVLRFRAPPKPSIRSGGQTRNLQRSTLPSHPGTYTSARRSKLMCPVAQSDGHDAPWPERSGRLHLTSPQPHASPLCHAGR